MKIEERRKSRVSWERKRKKKLRLFSFSSSFSSSFFSLSLFLLFRLFFFLLSFSSLAFFSFTFFFHLFSFTLFLPWWRDSSFVSRASLESSLSRIIAPSMTSWRPSNLKIQRILETLVWKKWLFLLPEFQGAIGEFLDEKRFLKDDITLGTLLQKHLGTRENPFLVKILLDSPLPDPSVMSPHPRKWLKRATLLWYVLPFIFTIVIEWKRLGEDAMIKSLTLSFGSVALASGWDFVRRLFIFGLNFRRIRLLKLSIGEQFHLLVDGWRLGASIFCSIVIAILFLINSSFWDWDLLIETILISSISFVFFTFENPELLMEVSGSVKRAVGFTLAWSYYVGYLRFVAGDDYWNKVVSREGDSLRKVLHILIPEDCEIHDRVYGVPDGDNCVVSLKLKRFNVAGTKGRAYRLTKYLVNETYYLLEYPAFLRTLQQMEESYEGANLTHSDRKLQALIFYETLSSILDNDRKMKERVKLIKYSGRDDWMQVVMSGH